MSREFKILKKSPQQLQREAFERRNKAEEEELRRKQEEAQKQNQSTQPQMLAAGTYAGVTPNVSEKKTDHGIKGPKIISRKDWGAKSADESKGYENIPTENLRVYYHSIVIHHSGNSDNSPTPKEVQKDHFEKGFADIGYHFLIDNKGRIYEGRPLKKMQAHVRGVHNGLIGIVLLSDLDSKNEGIKETYKKIGEMIDGDSTIQPEMLEGLINLIQYLNKTYGIKYLGGHKEFHEALNPKEEGSGDSRYCPGSDGMPIVEDLRVLFKYASPALMTKTDKNWFK